MSWRSTPIGGDPGRTIRIAAVRRHPTSWLRVGRSSPPRFLWAVLFQSWPLTGVLEHRLMLDLGGSWHYVERKGAELRPKEGQYMSDIAQKWLPYSVRATLFHKGAALPDSEKLLSRFESELESSTKTGKVEHAAIGSLGAGKLSITQKPMRLDVVWETPIQSDMTMLGETKEVLEHLLSPLMSLSVDNNWIRVAIGVHAGERVANHIAGYQEMDHLFPDLALNGETTSDFSFQINRFAQIDLPSGGIRLNRLARWGVKKVSFAVLLMDSTGPVSEQDEEELYLAGVELDINSAVSPGRELAGNEALLIMERACLEACAMIERGEYGR